MQQPVQGQALGNARAEQIARKGIVLAGGKGSRLFPITMGISKQLLPIYDKPMIFYPLSVLMLAEIQDILIITAPDQKRFFQTLLGDGSQYGLKISYAEQEQPNGIAQALVIAEDFLAGSPCCLVLGDNLFYGQGFSKQLKQASASCHGAILFGYPVSDPERFGVVGLDSTGKVTSLEEKPSTPASNYAVTGLYFYQEDAPKLAKQLKPSGRGEFEITDLNRLYLEQGRLQVELLGRGFSWLDTGTHDSLLEASHYIQTIERRQGLKVACLEEIAWRKGWLDDADLEERAKHYNNSPYGDYIKYLVKAGR